MKKYIFVISVLGLLFSCSGEKKQTEKTPEEMQNQIEAVEKSTQQLDEVIESSDYEMNKNQSEFDSLLNNL